MNQKRALHLVFFLLTVVVFVWLGLRNVVPSGEVVYTQTFDGPTNPYISDLWPPGALGPKEDSSRYFVKDAVTFFIRPPRYFERAQMQFLVDHPRGLTPQLYVQTEPGVDVWKEIAWQANRLEPNGSMVYQATFELNPEWRNEQGRYNMKLYFKGLAASGEQGRMRVMSVRFLGEPVSFTNWWRLLRI